MKAIFACSLIFHLALIFRQVDCKKKIITKRNHKASTQMATWHPAANLTPATSLTPGAAVLSLSSHHKADKSWENVLV